MVQSTDATRAGSDAAEHPARPAVTMTAPIQASASCQLPDMGSHLLPVHPEQLREDFVLEPAIRIEGPELDLHRARVAMLVEQLDLLDQPIEAEPYGRIRDPVLARKILQRSRSQEEPLQEREVLLGELVDPSAVRPSVHVHSFGRG